MMTQNIVNHHCKEIREAIKKKEYWQVSCINYLKNHASSEETRRDWQWIGGQLVMNGWLTVNADNNFEVKL